MKKSKIILIIIAILIIAGGLYLVNNKEESAAIKAFGFGQKVTMYKDPNCGCCTGYADELEKQGFEVEITNTKDMSQIKEKYQISGDKQSCHTIVMGDYFIEGHVPMEAVEKLLEEQPEIEGIGLSGMPSGTPGMPGLKTGSYEIYQSAGGEFGEYITI